MTIPQYETDHATVATLHGEKLIPLNNGMVILESEFKLLRDVLTPKPQLNTKIKLLPKTNEARSQAEIVRFEKIETPINHVSHNQISSNWLNYIPACLMLGGFFIASMTLVKVWGTTDAAKLDYQTSALERQYDELGKRYDKIAKLAAKSGEKANICVSFYCGGSSKSSDSEEAKDEPKSVQPTSRITPNKSRNYSSISNLSNADYENAVLQIEDWDAQGYSKKDIQEFIRWIRENPKSGYPSHKSLVKAFYIKNADY
jgi:hypothetical protein